MKKISKTVWFALAVILMGALLVGCYFIPVMGPSSRYNSKSYSCNDIVVAMNAETKEDLSEAQIEAWRAISKTEGTAGKYAKAMGVVGLVVAMVGGVLAVAGVASIFLKQFNLRSCLLGLSVGALVGVIALLVIGCLYLGLPANSAVNYSYYHAFKAAPFVMLSACLVAGAASWFTVEKE